MNHSQMRILFLTGIYPPVNGGAAIHYYHLLQVLQKFSSIDKLIIITEYVHTTRIFEENNKIQIFRLLPPRFSSKLYQYRFYRFLIGLITFMILPPLIVFLKYVYTIDCIHIHCSLARIIILKTAKLFNFKVIVDQRDKFILSEYKYADAILSCSVNIFEILLKKGIDDKKVIKTNVLLPSFKIPERKEVYEILNKYEILKPYILFVGDITEKKGVVELLQAFKLFQMEVSGISLVFVGRNVMGNQFLTLILKIKNVKYIGLLPHTHAICLMSGMDMLILPSKSEGLPSVILEAIRLGKKVVVPPNISEYDKYIPHLVIRDITPDSIYDKMKDVYTQNYICQYPIELHCPSSIALQTKNVYESLCLNSKNNISI